MIKRLKWNVLYGESAEDDSGLSDGSDESAQRGSHNVQAVLDTLARNDPTLLSTHLCMREETSSSDEDEGKNAERRTAEASVTELGQETFDNFEEVKYAEWRECQLCPGKRFLNDAEVELHLKSKRHEKAVRRVERLSRSYRNTVKAETSDKTVDDCGFTPPDNQCPTHRDDIECGSKLTGDHGKTHSVQMRVPDASQDTHHRVRDHYSCIPEHEATEDERRRVEKRKAAVKRKLKALKRRKWEKQMKLERPNQLVENRKEAQQDILDDDSEVKDELEFRPRQQKKKKRASRTTRPNTDIARRERSPGGDENDLSPQHKKFRPNKKRRKFEQPQMPREEEQQRKNSAEHKLRQRISRDVIEQSRRTENML